MKTHISYETAKKLKEFLGESAPNPISCFWWTLKNGYRVPLYGALSGCPAYQLHDLLSEPFCEAMAVKTGIHENEALLADQRLAVKLFWLWYTNGLPAVEKALLETMEASK